MATKESITQPDYPDLYDDPVPFCDWPLCLRLAVAAECVAGVVMLAVLPVLVWMLLAWIGGAI